MWLRPVLLCKAPSGAALSAATSSWASRRRRSRKLNDHRSSRRRQPSPASLTLQVTPPRNPPGSDALCVRSRDACSSRLRPAQRSASRRQQLSAAQRRATAAVRDRACREAASATTFDLDCGRHRVVLADQRIADGGHALRSAAAVAAAILDPTSGPFPERILDPSIAPADAVSSRTDSLREEGYAL